MHIIAIKEGRQTAYVASICFDSLYLVDDVEEAAQFTDSEIAAAVHAVKNLHFASSQAVTIQAQPAII